MPWVVEVRIGTGDKAEWKPLRPSHSTIPYEFESYGAARGMAQLCYPDGADVRVVAVQAVEVYDLDKIEVLLDGKRIGGEA